MERAASPPKAKTSAICSGKSRTPSPLTSINPTHPAESASTSSATQSFFRHEAAPGCLGYSCAQSASTARILDYWKDRIACSPRARVSARNGSDTSQSGCWHAPEHSPSSGREFGRLSQLTLGNGSGSARPTHTVHPGPRGIPWSYASLSRRLPPSPRPRRNGRRGSPRLPRRRLAGLRPARRPAHDRQRDGRTRPMSHGGRQTLTRTEPRRGVPTRPGRTHRHPGPSWIAARLINGERSLPPPP